MKIGDSKFFEHCDGCKLWKIHVSKRDVPLPIGNIVARSRVYMCTACFKKLLKAITISHDKYATDDLNNPRPSTEA
jgi:hypothetical protein